MTKIGNRVFTKIQRPDPALVQKFAGLPSSNINDEMNRLFCMHSYMRLLNPETANPSMVGTAVTVRAPIGDNLFFHQALDLAQPGDIIVVSNDEDRTRSLMGEIMFTYAQYQRKLGGLVLDGPIRDSDALKNMSLPVYATGATPGGPYKEGPGEINVPIACGGISVSPGDIIAADADGVIVTPLKDAADVLQAAKKYYAQDAAKVEAARNGTSDRAWVAKLIQDKHVEILDRAYWE